MKAKWVSAFMDTAERFAQLSSAVKLKVGSVVVKENRIISIGYNGTPSGWGNTSFSTNMYVGSGTTASAWSTSLGLQPGLGGMGESNNTANNSKGGIGGAVLILY